MEDNLISYHIHGEQFGNTENDSLSRKNPYNIVYTLLILEATDQNIYLSGKITSENDFFFLRFMYFVMFFYNECELLG